MSKYHSNNSTSIVSFVQKRMPTTAFFLANLNVTEESSPPLLSTCSGKLKVNNLFLRILKKSMTPH